MDVFSKLELLNTVNGICCIILGILFFATTIFRFISTISTFVKSKDYQRLPGILSEFLILSMSTVIIKVGIHMMF